MENREKRLDETKKEVKMLYDKARRVKLETQIEKEVFQEKIEKNPKCLKPKVYKNIWRHLIRNFSN